MVESKPGAAIPPDDAFALLGNATRMAILRELWEVRDPFAPPVDNALSFTELRERVGLDDPGQLNYHLNQLVGPFVRRTDIGYLLQPTATGVMRAVAIGNITDEGETLRTEADAPCPFCGGTVEVRYDQPTLTVRCTDCPGEYHTAVSPEGTLMSTEGFPPMGVEGRDGQALWEAVATYIAVRAFGFLQGVCPECMVEPETSIAVCSDHAGQGICERCGSTQAALATLRCVNCKAVYRFPAWVTVMLHPDVIGFFHERDVDTYGGLTLDVYNRLLTARELVHETDPLVLEVVVEVAGDELSATIDESLAVIEVRTDGQSVDSVRG